MAFATLWLEKKALFPQLVEEPSEKSTGIIVVIPAFDEPEIAKLLDSLASCTPPSCGVEIIVIVNAVLMCRRSILNNGCVLILLLSGRAQTPDVFSDFLFLIPDAHLSPDGEQDWPEKQGWTKL
jgi:hypothetical protein